MRNLSEQPEVAERFWQLLIAYVVHGDLKEAPSFLPQQPYLVFANVLRSAMELFVAIDTDDGGFAISEGSSRSRSDPGIVPA
ncbi:MAG: hypothetical protein ACRD2W_16565 [Acidimicrobiales bacterium]